VGIFRGSGRLQVAVGICRWRQQLQVADRGCGWRVRQQFVAEAAGRGWRQQRDSGCRWRGVFDFTGCSSRLMFCLVEVTGGGWRVEQVFWQVITVAVEAEAD